jgi:AMP deaminase
LTFFDLFCFFSDFSLTFYFFDFFRRLFFSLTFFDTLTFADFYIRNPNEWSKLGEWICDNNLFSSNVRWLIQIPRLYSEFKENKMIENIGQLFNNIFQPLFEVTKNPKSNPKLFMFLTQVVGFDCVDDESKPDKKFMSK